MIVSIIHCNMSYVMGKRALRSLLLSYPKPTIVLCCITDYIL